MSEKPVFKKRKYEGLKSRDQLNEEYQEYLVWFQAKKAEGKEACKEIVKQGLGYFANETDYFPTRLEFGQWCVATADFKNIMLAINDRKEFNAEVRAYETEWINDKYVERLNKMKEDNARGAETDSLYQASIALDDKVLKTSAPKIQSKTPKKQSKAINKMGKLLRGIGFELGLVKGKDLENEKD